MSEQKTILVSVSGPDGPGISAGLMDALHAGGAEIYDVEQIVVRGRLTLEVLFGVTTEQATIKDLLFFGWEKGLHIDFELIEADPAPIKRMAVVTVIGATVSAAQFGAVARAIANGGGNIERIFRLSRYPVVSYELVISNGDLDTIRTELVAVAAGAPIDLAIQPDGLERRAKRLVVLDVDSTLIQQEVIDLLAAEAGHADEVQRITAAAMAGEIDFLDSLNRRVALLAGIDHDALARVATQMTLTPGAKTFIRTLHRMGLKTAIVSAGFTRFTEALAAELGVDYALSNTLEVVDGKVTGRLTGELVDAKRKEQFLTEVAAKEGIPMSQTVAVGDGANDLLMLAAAGLGIAFNAKPIVTEQADTAVSVPFLDAILFLMGVSRDHVEAADAADPEYHPPPLIDVEGTPPV